MRLGFCGLLTVAAAIILHSAESSAQERVEVAPVTYRQSKFAQARAQQDQPAAPAPLTSYLYKPKEAGPFPAIVLMHGCGGLGGPSSRYIGIAKDLVAKGYVVLSVDSFDTRGIKQACDSAMPDRRADALGALVYLSKMPDIAADRIAMLGYSQGGIVGLQVATMKPQNIYDMPDTLHYRAVVNFYPLCRLASETFTVPSLILIGRDDDWTPAKDCERIFERQSGEALKLIVYPGATHGFDNPNNGTGRLDFGYSVKMPPMRPRNLPSR